MLGTEAMNPVQLGHKTRNKEEGEEEKLGKTSLSTVRLHFGR